MTKRAASTDLQFPWKILKHSESSEALAKNYEKLQENYLKDFFSQETLFLLKGILKNTQIPIECKNAPLLRILQEISKALFLNNLEVTMWKIYLDRLVWTDNSKALPILLLFSAFAAKSLMNSKFDTEVILSCMENKYPGFVKGFTDWQDLHSDELSVSVRNFNSCFNVDRNFEVKQLIDYNFYVDDLLEIAPAVVYEKEQKIELFTGNEDFIPELMNLNSIILINDEFSAKQERSSGLVDIENIENLDYELSMPSRLRSLVDI